MPEITVAITTHNLERYMASCLEELMAQSFQDFEILVFDDSSTDKTCEILREYREKLGEKLCILPPREAQRLPGRSRNVILDSGRIRGKYLVFLDGDDSLEANYLEKLYTTAEHTQADITICAYDRVEADSGRVLCREMHGFPPELSLDKADPAAVPLAFLNTALWNKLIRTELIGEQRMPAFAVGEDACFLLSLYMDCCKLSFVEDTLIHYRVRGSSVIANTPEESIYAFEAELYALYKKAQTQWLRDNLSFAAFVHIGLSMSLRAADNPACDCAALLRWMRKRFAEQYHWFRGNPCFRLSALCRNGFKGLAIWVALQSHKLGIFPVLIRTYKLATRTLGIDMKF